MRTVYPKSKFPDTYAFLEKIFDNTYNGVAILTLDIEWIKVNNSLCEMLGYSREELMQTPVGSIIFREDSNTHDQKNWDLISGKIDQYRVEQRYFSKRGDIIWFLISATLVNDHFGEPSHLIWQFTDITRLKDNQNRMKMMLNVVRDQNDRLKNFVDIITHNLRSHAGNLTTLMDFLKEENPSLSSSDNFELLNTAVVNLTETVDHLTDVIKIKQVDKSKIEALNLWKYVDNAIYNIAAIALNTEATIDNNVDKGLFVMAIPAYLDSIILNFLTNAIKYRSHDRKPKITLTTSVQGDYVVLNVVDNGLGIDLEKYGEKLFQMYRTFHCNEDAVGIGLFITKNHIESIGGKVFVKSEVDVGTEFSIYLKKG